MRRDAQKDPAVFPDALHARTLINQVLQTSFLDYNDQKLAGFSWPKSILFFCLVGNSLFVQTNICRWLRVFQVDRKLVKQTVMTSVYGVTYIGARDQIKRRLKERGLIADEAEIFRSSCYAAKVERKY